MIYIYHNLPVSTRQFRTNRHWLDNPIIQSMRMFKKQCYVRVGFGFGGYVAWQRTKREMRTKTKMKMEMERRRIRSCFCFCLSILAWCHIAQWKRSLFLGEFFAEFVAMICCHILIRVDRGCGAKWHRSCPMQSLHPVVEVRISGQERRGW